MSYLISIILIAFCISLYFPFWYLLIYKWQTNIRKIDWYKFGQLAFNTLLVLITFFTPALLYLCEPLPNNTELKTISDRVLAFAKPYLFKLIFVYLIIFFIIYRVQKSFSAKKKYKILQILLIDKNFQNISSEFFTLVISFIILLYPETETNQVKAFSLMLFCLSSSNFCYLIFENGLKKYSLKELQ